MVPLSLLCGLEISDYISERFTGAVLLGAFILGFFFYKFSYHRHIKALSYYVISEYLSRTHKNDENTTRGKN